MNIIPIFVPHLGCPNECVFCNQRAISGQVKPVSTQDVEEILKSAKGKVKGDFEVAFYGGSFTAICESLQDELLDVALKFCDNIRISTRPDYISQEILDRLKQKGVKTIELGVQSMRDDVLEISKRGHTAKDAINASELIKKNGFVLGIQLMIGLPKDSVDGLMYTVEEICKIKPNIARVYPIVVIEQTELYEMYKSGEYIPIGVEEAVELSAIVVEKLEQSDINVIRVGLNPSEDLSNGKAVAGAYHPAFGQLVSSKRYLAKMEKLLNRYRGDSVVFGVHRSEISTAVGQKRINAKEIYKKYNIKVKIKEVDVSKGDILIIEE